MLKTTLRKHAVQHGTQWDKYLSGIFFVYHNIPYDSTGEKPTYLLSGMDCKIPTDARMLSPSPLQPAEMRDYHGEMPLSLWSGCQNAAQAIQAAQRRYKAHYDSKVTPANYVIGDWVLVKFSSEESGRMHKLSRQWHAPYCITNTRGPDVDITKVYRPQDDGIQVHQIWSKTLSS